MMHNPLFLAASIACCFAPLAVTVHAQGTPADYQRAATLRAKYQAAALNLPETPNWLDGDRFWYRKTVVGGHQFVLVDTGGAKTAAFDHEKLALSLSKRSGETYSAVKLPFSTFSFADDGKAIEMIVADSRFKCSLVDYTCQKLGPMTTGARSLRPSPKNCRANSH